MDGHRSRVFGVCFNPRSSHELISGGWDNTIQFWDIRQPYALRRISGAHICGDALDISRNGKEVYVLVSRIQKSKVVSTLTRSYSYGNVYKNCRSSFFWNQILVPKTTHPLTQYAFCRVFSFSFLFFSFFFSSTNSKLLATIRQFIFLQLLIFVR